MKINEEKKLIPPKISDTIIYYILLYMYIYEILGGGEGWGVEWWSNIGEKEQ